MRVFVCFLGLRGFLFVFVVCFCWGISDGIGFVSEIYNYEEYRVSKRYIASTSITHLAKWDALETEKERLTVPSFFYFTSPL